MRSGASTGPRRSRADVDLWMNAWVMQGLVDVWRLFGDKNYLTAASRIGDLCIRTFTKGGAASWTPARSAGPVRRASW